MHCIVVSSSVCVDFITTTSLCKVATLRWNIPKLLPLFSTCCKRRSKRSVHLCTNSVASLFPLCITVKRWVSVVSFVLCGSSAPCMVFSNCCILTWRRYGSALMAAFSISLCCRAPWTLSSALSLVICSYCTNSSSACCPSNNCYSCKSVCWPQRKFSLVKRSMTLLVGSSSTVHNTACQWMVGVYNVE